MDFDELSDKISRSIVSVVAEEMVKDLGDMPSNVAENLSYDDAYNDTELSNEELVTAYRKITKKIILSIRTRFA